jgi:hypothetical protein
MSERSTTAAADEAAGNRLAGIAAAFAVTSAFAALLLLLSSTSAASTGSAARTSLLDADDGERTLLVATALRVVSLLLFAVVGRRLIVLVRARTATIPAWLGPLAIAAPLLAAVTAILGHVALLDAAHAFTDAGPRTELRADHLLHDGDLQRIAGVAGIFLSLPFAVWLAMASHAGMRAGLLTATLGWWGVAAAIASVLLAVAGQGLVLGWLGSLALLLLGWWPGGRGPAWTSGTAEPWGTGRRGRTDRGAPA